MPFPKTEDELKAQGYRFKDKARCRGCNAVILWYETPNSKLMPLDPETLEPHWGSCPERDRFKKPKPERT
ncbi:MAG TPA: hypothetical protein VIY07_16805 [Pseudolabrys sp.]